MIRSAGMMVAFGASVEAQGVVWLLCVAVILALAAMTLFSALRQGD